MSEESLIRATLAATDATAAANPTWGAFAVWAVRGQALYDDSRLQWRRQSPAIDVAAQEGAYGYDVTPALLSIRARLGVSEGGGPVLP